MYNKSLKTLVALIIGAMTVSSCIGSFGLFNKVLSWNKRATGSKFLNEIIFILISPAYAVCGTVDLFVLNTIEFWSGDNPMASNVGKTLNIMGSDGIMYAVTYLKDGYEIKDDKGNVVNFVFDKNEKTWTMDSDKGTVKLLKMKDADTAEIYLKDGSAKDVSLNEQGVYETQMAVNDGLFFALR